MLTVAIVRARPCVGRSAPRWFVLYVSSSCVYWRRPDSVMRSCLQMCVALRLLGPQGGKRLAPEALRLA